MGEMEKVQIKKQNKVEISLKDVPLSALVSLVWVFPYCFDLYLFKLLSCKSVISTVL